MKLRDMIYMLESSSPIKVSIYKDGYLKESRITQTEALKKFGDETVSKIRLEDSTEVILVLE